MRGYEDKRQLRPRFCFHFCEGISTIEMWERISVRAVHADCTGQVCLQMQTQLFFYQKNKGRTQLPFCLLTYGCFYSQPAALVTVKSTFCAKQYCSKRKKGKNPVRLRVRVPVGLLRHNNTSLFVSCLGVSLANFPCRLQLNAMSFTKRKITKATKEKPRN